MTTFELNFLPDLGDRNTGKIAVATSPVFYDRLKEIPGYAWSIPGKVSTVPRAWPAVLALSSLAQKYKVSLAPDAEVLEWYRKNAAEWKNLRVSAINLGSDMEKAEGFSYYPHQIKGAEWLLLDSETKGRALLDQTGAGKTGTIIRAIQQGKLHESGPVLVVCPESVMETGWVDGVKKFAPELRVTQVVGTATQRTKTFDQVIEGEFDVVVLGYSNLRTSTRLEANPGQALRRCIACGGPRLTVGERDQETGKIIPTINPETGKEIKEVTVAQCQSHHKVLNDIPWSLIVADEIHRALNPKSQTTQALWGVGKYAPSNPMRWGATGTPVSTHVDQAWPILHFLDASAWPSGSRSKWVSWNCDAGFSYAGFWEVRGLKDDKKDEFQATWTAVTRRVLKEQVLKDLPPKLRWGSLEERITMPKTSEQYKVYTSMKEEMLAQVAEGVITAKNVLVQAKRLSMLASGTGKPVGDTDEMDIRMPSVKVDTLIQMWKDKEWEGEQIAILFSSRKVLKMVESELYAAGMIKPETVALIHGEIPQARRSLDINDFQSGKRDVAMLTYAAGGTGITLTAASTVIVFERDWSPILNAQGEDRFHRIGSERHAAITYRDLVVAGTIEVKQLDRMEENAATLESIVNDKEKLLALFGG